MTIFGLSEKLLPKSVIGMMCFAQMDGFLDHKEVPFTHPTLPAL